MEKTIVTEVNEKDCAEAAVSNCFIKKYCTDEWLPIVEANESVNYYSKGETIFKVGQPVTGMMSVDSGKVKVIAHYDTDKLHIVRLASNGDILGHRGVGGDWHYPVSAVALSDCKISYLPNDIFNKVLKANPELCYNLMIFFAEELRRSEEDVKNQVNMTVRERMANSIVKVIDVFGYHPEDETLLSFTPSRKDFSNIAGTTYETVIRMISDFAKNNFLKIEGKKLRILKEEKLREIARHAGNE